MKTLKNRSKIYITAIGLVVAAVLITTPMLLSGNNDSTTVKEKSTSIAPPAAVLTDVFLVRKTELENEINTIGSVVADKEVVLVSEVARKITGVYAKEGAEVKKGTLLFKLDDADLLARKKKLVLQEKLALLDEKRFRELLATEAVNQQEYDEISTKLKVLQADIELIDVELSKTEIRAPFDGKIGLNKVDVGSYVTPSKELSIIENVSKVELDFTVSEKYSTEIKTGQKIQFTTENNRKTFDAVIVATEPGNDLSTRSLRVKALAENMEGKLVPGTSAKIRFSLKKIQDGIIVPTQALIPTSQGYSLFAVKDGKADYREVKTGARNKATIRIEEGLSDGDTVITSNLLRLGPGVPVQIAEIE